MAFELHGSLVFLTSRDLGERFWGSLGFFELSHPATTPSYDPTLIMNLCGRAIVARKRGEGGGSSGGGSGGTTRLEESEVVDFSFLENFRAS